MTDYVLIAPKTKARRIDLPADLAKVRTTYTIATKGDFVFPLHERNFRSRVWHDSLRRAGLTRRPHP